MKLGTGSLVRQMEERFCVENEDEEHADLISSSVEEANMWVEDILEQVEDVSNWSKAVSGPGDALSGGEERLVRRRLKQKTASKLMLFYNRISSGDLMERNLLRNEKIMRNT